MDGRGNEIGSMMLSPNPAMRMQGIMLARMDILYIIPQFNINHRIPV
jgi:hypothetical protein